MTYKKLLITTALPFSALFAAQEASAHISYIDLQTDTAVQTTVNPDGSTTYYNDYLTVESNGGWADATDADWGNSHGVLSWNSFYVANPGGALVNLTVTGDSSSRYYSNGTYNTTGAGYLASVGGFTPGFTLYSGLLPSMANDESVTPPPSISGKEGAVQALADTTMGNGSGNLYGYDDFGNPVLLYSDPGTVGTIDYLTHAGTVNGTATSASLGDYYLAQGWYTMIIGGTCYLCQIPDPANYDFTDPAQEALFNQLESDAKTSRGFSVSLNVAPVPVPAAVWLMGSGLLGLLGISKRRSSVA